LVAEVSARRKYHETIEFIKSHKVYRYLYIAEDLTGVGRKRDD
jgi:hypothetical protein